MEEGNSNILKEVQGNLGFKIITLYAYEDYIEFVTKKNVSTVIKYADIRSLKNNKSTISIEVNSKKTFIFGISGDTEEWKNFIFEKAKVYIEEATKEREAEALKIKEEEERRAVRRKELEEERKKEAEKKKEEKTKKQGVFASSQKSSAKYEYNQMKAYLKEKDGKIHVVMINSFSKFVNQNFGCESKYTVQIDEIVTSMQDDGYEIIDIKFNSLRGQGIIGNMEGYHTLITYK